MTVRDPPPDHHLAGERDWIAAEIARTRGCAAACFHDVAPHTPHGLGCHDAPPCQFPRRPTYDPGSLVLDGDRLAFMPPAQQGCPWPPQTILEPSEFPSRGTLAAEGLRWACWSVKPTRSVAAPL